MKKKNKLLIFDLILIIVITVLAVITITQKNKEYKIAFENTDVSQRILINDFLQRNPYISNINGFDNELITDTDIVKSAIYSEDVELNYIITEEIDENELLSKFEGYKKSIENIKLYAKEVFKRENLELNFVDTYYNETGYLFLNDEFVYFTKQENPEKVYITVGQNQQENFLQVQVYEYTVNGNKEQLEEMLQTGVIDKSINTSNEFVLKIKIENEKICVLEKN